MTLTYVPYTQNMSHLCPKICSWQEGSDVNATKRMDVAQNSYSVVFHFYVHVIWQVFCNSWKMQNRLQKAKWWQESLTVFIYLQYFSVVIFVNRTYGWPCGKLVGAVKVVVTGVTQLYLSLIHLISRKLFANTHKKTADSLSSRLVGPAHGQSCKHGNLQRINKTKLCIF